MRKAQIKEEPQNRNAEEMAKIFASKIPKLTNFNNTKTRKYFSSKPKEEGDATQTLKDTLLYNISTHTESMSTANKNESISSNFKSANVGMKNELTPSKIIKSVTGDSGKNNYLRATQQQFGTLPKSHHKKNSSNILIVSKEIGKFAENYKSTPKVLHKIPAKFMEDDDLIVESDQEDLNENVPNNYKQNRTVENVKKNKIEDSICAVKEKLNNTDIDFLNSSHKIKINFEALISVENIYSLFMKELEVKKHKQSDYDSLVIKYFEIVINNYDSIYILEQSLNDKSIKKALQQFFMQEIIIFSLAYNRHLNKGDQLSLNLYNAIKTCFFYLHQNLIILLFIGSVIFRKYIAEDEGDNNPNSIGSSANSTYMNLSKAKVEENKIWLNKHNYKKYLKSNNKTVIGIIKNMLKQIKAHEVENAEKSEEYKESNRHHEEMSNVSIIINYIKNMGKYKTEVIRDNLYKNFISERFIEVESDKKSEEKVENFNDLENNVNTVAELVQPPVPFLPQTVSENKKYTLVLDLDETLVHYVEDEESAYIQIRPGAENFLEEMSEFFEIVVFTAAMQDYADLVLDELDKNRRVSFRLYRQHTLNSESYYIKDLSKLGRSLETTLIIDNVADNFKLQPMNGLNIKNFEGDENDIELIELTEDLKNIVRLEVDVRDALPKIREKMTARYMQIIKEGDDFSFDANIDRIRDNLGALSVSEEKER